MIPTNPKTKKAARIQATPEERAAFEKAEQELSQEDISMVPAALPELSAEGEDDNEALEKAEVIRRFPNPIDTSADPDLGEEFEFFKNL